MQHLLYLFIDLGCLGVPLIASFYKKHSFYTQWRYFFPANLLVALVFLIWDEWFTQIEIWGFNPEYLTGFYIGHLPIEEILFFICIPYACVFTYFAFQYLFPRITNSNKTKLITPLFIVILIITGLYAIEKYYTSITFISLSIFLTYLYLKKIYLDIYFLAFVAILPFFFLSNGILTGSFLETPIVWYNDSENLGIRMFTIPIEDTFYGMLLIFGNIYLYEYFKKKITWKK